MGLFSTHTHLERRRKKKLVFCFALIIMDEHIFKRRVARIINYPFFPARSPILGFGYMASRKTK